MTSDHATLVRVSRLYYEVGETQERIAARLGVTRPQVSKLLRLARERGVVEIRIVDRDEAGSPLAEALRDRSANLGGLVTRRPPYQLDLILAGESTPTPYELLKSKTFSDLLIEARQSYDLVIVDAPPIVSLPDCRLLGNLVDGFIIVVAANRTPRKLLEEALNALNPEMVLGLVFNNDQEASRYASYYGYYAAYGAKSGKHRGSDGDR